MAEKITAEPRVQFGKGAARKLRAAGRIPAVIYGHGTDPEHISLPGHETGLIVRRANAVLEIAVSGESRLALVKDVQKDPVRQIIEHIDLLVVRSGEKVQVEVPVHLDGESAPGTIATLDIQSLLLEVEATHIPEHVVVDITGAEDGQHVLAGAIALPEGASLASDPEQLVVAVVAEAAEEEEAAPAADAEAEVPESAEATA